MADDLDRLVDSIRGEGPSAEFVTALRERIVAETSERELVVDEFAVDAASQPDPLRGTTAPTRWMLVALAAAIVIIVGFVAVTRDGDEGGIVTTQEPATFVADAPPLTQDYSLIERGTYRIDTLGTPFTLTFDEAKAVQNNSNAHVVLAHPGSQGPDDRDITFMRLSTLADPARPTVALEEPGDGWPAGDVDGWIRNLSGEVIVSNREDTTLGGIDAIRFDLELGETGCGPADAPCVVFATNRLVSSRVLNPGSKYRIWFVDQDGEDPLAVVVGIDRETDVGWFDTAEGILATLAFDDVAPNPILDATAGRIELPHLGGIRMELSEGSVVLQDPRGFGRVLVDYWPGDTEFLTNPLDADGTALATADDLVTELRAGDVDVVEIESTVIGGIEARVFDIGATAAASSPAAPLLKLTLDAPDGWRPPPMGRMWLIEHPERGLLMITAEAFENLDIAFPLALAQTEAILASLEFVEPS